MVLCILVSFKLPITFVRLAFLVPFRRREHRSSGYLSNPSKERTYKSHSLIFQSFWDPDGLPEFAGFLPKCSRILSP